VQNEILLDNKRRSYAEGKGKHGKVQRYQVFSTCVTAISRIAADQVIRNVAINTTLICPSHSAFQVTVVLVIERAAERDRGQYVCV